MSQYRFAVYSVTPVKYLIAGPMNMSIPQTFENKWQQLRQGEQRRSGYVERPKFYLARNNKKSVFEENFFLSKRVDSIVL